METKEEKSYEGRRVILPMNLFYEMLGHLERWGAHRLYKKLMDAVKELPQC
jgi:hypothetical protein